MSKRPGRFGDLPVAEPRRGLPLPLVTQQMAVQLPITTMVDQTSIQTLTAPVAVTTAIGVPGPPTSQGQRPGTFSDYLTEIAPRLGSADSERRERHE